MVKVREERPLSADGTVDLTKWLQRHCSHFNKEACDFIQRACMLSHQHGEKILTCVGQSCFHQGLEIAEILFSLQLDHETIAAAIILSCVSDAGLSINVVAETLNTNVAHLVEGVGRMRAIEALQPIDHAKEKEAVRLDRLRKMLIAMAEDVRIVLIKLAEHLCILRAVKSGAEKQRRHIAKQAQAIFAPLANRLGVAQIKWEMEDLAFRYLQPAMYKRIAYLLDERRVDRQRYIERVIEKIKQELKKDNVHAEIQGRIKHIYSIYRKMQRKNIEYSEIYDVRAVRVLVDTVQDCYMALGIVHRLWPYIPNEFDDYIATPKENGYRSLHTAVIGPSGKALEVQIRTHEMHQESELGVAAHWRYKEGSARDADYEDKIAWLRQLLDWQTEVVDSSELIDELRIKVTEERIYVLTPKGDIIDLPTGATPLDFAYHVHTEVGHRCRGAKINGKIVPLTYQLKNGEQVFVLTGPNANPSRDWLSPHLGYLHTSRARAKVHAWFKLQARDSNISEGQQLMERELARLNIDHIDYDSIAAKLNVNSGEDVMAGLGSGDIRLAQIFNAAQISLRPPEGAQLKIKPVGKRRVTAPGGGDITIEGVGNLLTSLARCCKPVPGDAIVGYITQGRGVSIHRQDCSNILHIQPERMARLIEVDWGGVHEKTYPVDIFIEAYDRANLLRDITALLANERINVLALETHAEKDNNLVNTIVTIEIANVTALGRLFDRLNQLPNVTRVQRN